MTDLLPLMVTDWFKDNYEDIDLSVPKVLRLKLYTRGPLFAEASLNVFRTFEGMSDLAARPEWVEVTDSLVSKLTSSGTAEDLYLESSTSGDTDLIQIVDSVGNAVAIEDGTGWYLDDDPSQNIIYAAVFYLEGTYDSVVDPIVVATTRGIGELTVAQSGTVYGQIKTGAPSGEQYILIRNNLSNEYRIGYLLLNVADPVWESSHTHHLWIEPQRVNFIANPSFERTGGVFWRVGRESGTATLSSTGTSGSPAGVDKSLKSRSITERYRCGNIQGSTGSGKLILESNFFPKVNDWYSLSFYVSGTEGDLSYGLVITDQFYGSFSYLKNRVPLSLSGGSSTENFQKVEALVQIPDDVADVMFRIEFTGSQFWLDQVLVDPHEGQYEYFDGNSDDGLPSDFRWMGGSTYEDKHFSVWYNNYRNTRSRMIGDYDTTDDIYKPGLVEEWAPTGSSIIAHWNSVTSITPLNWQGDAFYPVSDVKGTPVNTITGTFDFTLNPIT